jgi:hypothetical protein
MGTSKAPKPPLVARKRLGDPGALLDFSDRFLCSSNEAQAARFGSQIVYYRRVSLVQEARACRDVGEKSVGNASRLWLMGQPA